MDRKKYSYLRQLKLDKNKFEKKLYYYETKISLDEKIESLTSQIKETRANKNELIQISKACDNILRTYIAELHAKIFPHTWQKNYGEKNIEMNLSNLSMLTYLQKVKNKVFINDKYKLEDEVIDIFYKEDKKQTNKIKNQIKADKKEGQIMENEKYELSLIKDNFRNIIHDIEKYEMDLKIYKLKYDIVLRNNKKLNKMLEQQKIMHEEICKKLKEKNNNYKTLKIEINDSNKNKNNKNKQINLNYRSFSDKNYLSIKNKRKISLKLFKDKNKKIKINPFLIKNYKGYKTPLLFLKTNNIFEKNIRTLNDNRLVNAYDFLNIFTNNNKKTNSINEFINSFNNLSKKKLSFYNTTEDKSTKMTSLSSNNSIIKSNTITNNSMRNIKKQSIYKVNSRLFSPQYKNEMYILRDYLYTLIDEQKEIIKDLKNKNAEEIRSISQIKYILSRCINDINIDIYDKNNINNNNNSNNNKSIDENMIDNVGDINEEDGKLLYILTYIYDNCFNGINNVESIFPEFRNNNNSKIFFFNNKNNQDKIEVLHKRCFSCRGIK